MQEWLCLSRRDKPDLVTNVWQVVKDYRLFTLPANCNIDMINIFETFLPQLLRYPNPNDPLNGEAAALLMRHPKEYEAKVKGAWSISFH